MTPAEKKLLDAVERLVELLDEDFFYKHDLNKALVKDRPKAWEIA